MSMSMVRAARIKAATSYRSMVSMLIDEALALSGSGTVMA